ncbi:hypothetical protein LCGC14_1738950 [marine sediment metagenome]|uniref:Class I SAM-dependent methyltransferase n=1 Tax=marine sediment metagenome TaxID=412755 RepID=A0A0F9HUY6_9ZZZZ
MEPELIEGQVLPEEGAYLRRAAREVLGSQAIVELGSYTGKSTSCLAAGSAEGLRASVYAVDLWTHGAATPDERAFFDRKKDPDRPGSNCKFTRPGALEKFRERMTEYDKLGLVTPLQGATLEVVKTFDKEIGLLFIDADHRYEAVSADFWAWSPKVVPFGIVAFHDYKGARPTSGVNRFVDTELVGHGWRIVHQVGSLCAVQRVP